MVEPLKTSRPSLEDMPLNSTHEELKKFIAYTPPAGPLPWGQLGPLKTALVGCLAECQGGLLHFAKTAEGTLYLLASCSIYGFLRIECCDDLWFNIFSQRDKVIRIIYNTSIINNICEFIASIKYNIQMSIGRSH